MWIIFFLFSLPFLYAEPLFVYLKGTCSAGKTTLNKLILQHWDNWVIAEEDAIAYEVYLETLSLDYPAGFVILQKAINDENLYHALRYKYVIFKEEASEEEREAAQLTLALIQNELNLPENYRWKKRVEEKIIEKELELIDASLRQNKNVIVDSWIFSADRMENIFQRPIVRVMIYCDLFTAFQRLNRRNDNALLSKRAEQIRFIKELVGSFSWLYCLSHEPNQALALVKENSLNDIFNHIADHLTDCHIEENGPFSLGEYSLKEFKAIQEKFMKPFEGHSSSLYLCPKKKQDIIIDSSLLNPEQLLKIVGDRLYLMRELR